MRKIRQIFCLICMLVAVGSVPSEAFGAKQKYTRRYQKKNTYVQKKDSYFQKQDLPVANAYLQVNRERPTVKVNYVPGQTVFRTDSDQVSCHAKNTFSCTTFGVSFSAETDCETSKIVLNVAETQAMTISISSAYEKGTCFFDQILKHELTHEKIYRKVLTSYLNKTAQDMILAYEEGQDTSKGCEEIQQRIAKTAQEAAKSYAKAAAAENAKIDSPQGDHLYNTDICEQQQHE